MNEAARRHQRSGHDYDLARRSPCGQFEEQNDAHSNYWDADTDDCSGPTRHERGDGRDHRLSPDYDSESTPLSGGWKHPPFRDRASLWRMMALVALRFGLVGIWTILAFASFQPPPAASWRFGRESRVCE